MKILGIETSCDETAAAVVQGGVDVLSNVIATSLKEHQAFGGIIPEIASRRQIEFIQWVVGESLSKANLTLKDIDAIAVTRSPGLLGSLLVGISFARGLARATGKPLIEIDHIKAHIYAAYLKMPGKEACPIEKVPAVGLVVSGGHSSLFYLENFKTFKILGSTRDDAAGEAFDKVARILELGYPGGPVIDRLAQSGINKEIRFPVSHLKGTYDFSLSGLKTAVLYYTQKHKGSEGYSEAKVAYAFQESVVEALVMKSLNACKAKKTNTLLVGGGVAANSALRKHLTEAALKEGINVYFPPMALCLDNAAMIAGLGYHWK
jgi:N6-L-threonylcarbamoyladenine synthase